MKNLKAQVDKYTDFNSNMVRLKDLSSTNLPWQGLNFNSNMVRLKVKLINKQLCQLPNFNSNMVRLKVEQNGWNVNQIYIFQFQYGSIKSFPKTKAIAFCFYFNSNMVRLKGAMIYCNYALDKDFNSNMVRLKVFIIYLMRPFFLISIPIWFD